MKNLRKILAEEGLLPEGRTALDWEQFAETPAPAAVWRNYNTIGPRQFIKTLAFEVMESRLPATWSITFDSAEIAKVKKKWWGKGSTVNLRGVKGKKITRGFQVLFIGTIGGKEAAVKQAEFKL